MSKKSKKRTARREAAEHVAHEEVAAPHRTRRIRLTAALLCACVLLAAGFAATRYNPARHFIGLSPLVAPATQGDWAGTLPLAKEYVYAGGRLVATEEPAPAATPTPTPAGPAELLRRACLGEGQRRI
jgi:hypothetical protein